MKYALNFGFDIKEELNSLYIASGGLCPQTPCFRDPLMAFARSLRQSTPVMNECDLDNKYVMRGSQKRQR